MHKTIEPGLPPCVVAAAVVLAVICPPTVRGLADEDEVLLTCKRGGAPGEYIHSGDSSMTWWGPLCFALDAEGKIYIPQYASSAGTRIHKFDPQGTLTVTLGIVAEGGQHMVVARSGDMYLVGGTGYYGKIINKHSSAGDFLYCLGPRGIIGSEPFPSRERGYDAEHERYFTYIPLMTVTPEADLLVQEGLGVSPGPMFYRFNGQGRLLEKGRDMPPEIATLTEKKERLDRILRESLRETNQKPLVYTLMAPDGDYYYMVYDDKELEIHRVTVVDEGTPSALEGSVPES